jgi:hypothetical protein
MNDAATSLVGAARIRPVARRISAARLIVAGVLMVEAAWVAGLALVVYEVVR